MAHPASSVHLDILASQVIAADRVTQDLVSQESQATAGSADILALVSQVIAASAGTLE